MSGGGGGGGGPGEGATRGHRHLRNHTTVPTGRPTTTTWTTYVPHTAAPHVVSSPFRRLHVNASHVLVSAYRADLKRALERSENSSRERKYYNNKKVRVSFVSVIIHYHTKHIFWIFLDIHEKVYNNHTVLPDRCSARRNLF